MNTEGDDIMLRQKPDTAEIVIYNFNIQKQSMSLLYRGESIPTHLREYKKLWCLYDKAQKVETIIISV